MQAKSPNRRVQRWEDKIYVNNVFCTYIPFEIFFFLNGNTYLETHLRFIPKQQYQVKQIKSSDEAEKSKIPRRQNTRIPPHFITGTVQVPGAEIFSLHGLRLYTFAT